MLWPLCILHIYVHWGWNVRWLEIDQTARCIWCIAGFDSLSYLNSLMKCQGALISDTSCTVGVRSGVRTRPQEIQFHIVYHRGVSPQRKLIQLDLQTVPLVPLVFVCKSWSCCNAVCAIFCCAKFCIKSCLISGQFYLMWGGYCTNHVAATPSNKVLTPRARRSSVQEW